MTNTCWEKRNFELIPAFAFNACEESIHMPHEKLNLQLPLLLINLSIVAQ
jgi:hypothetical protein